MMQSFPGHQVTSQHSIPLKSALLEATFLHYPDPSKCYIAYMDVSNDAYGAQLSQEHDSQELPVAFSHAHLQTPK